MRISKRQLRQIIKEEKFKLNEVLAAPTSELKDTVFKLFLEAGKVTTADVFDYMRMDGWADAESRW